MDKIPMITWVMPVYNGEKYLKQAIDSILSQKCTDFCIIIVDDGSTDGSVKIVNGYHDDRIRLLESNHGGAGAARNKGIEQAESAYIGFLDADDVLCSNAYDEYVYQVLASDQYDLIDFNYIEADSLLKKGIRSAACAVTEKQRKSIVDRDPYKSFCGSFYSVRLFQGDGGIRFPIGISNDEDCVFRFQAHMKANSLCMLDRQLFLYRNNIMSTRHNTINYSAKCLESAKAWYWMKKHCEAPYIDICDARTFALICRFINEKCIESRNAVKDIDQVLKSDMLLDVMTNYEKLWSSSKKSYEEYIASSEEYCRKMHTKGTRKRVLKRLSRLKLLRRLYFAFEYRTDTEKLVGRNDGKILYEIVL